MEINGKKVNWSDAINLLVVGICTWITFTLVQLDNRLTRMEQVVETMDNRGTSYVQNQVMTKLTELHTDVRHIKNTMK